MVKENHQTWGGKGNNKNNEVRFVSGGTRGGGKKINEHAGKKQPTFVLPEEKKLLFVVLGGGKRRSGVITSNVDKSRGRRGRLGKVQSGVTKGVNSKGKESDREVRNIS